MTDKDFLKILLKHLSQQRKWAWRHDRQLWRIYGTLEGIIETWLEDKELHDELK